MDNDTLTIPSNKVTIQNLDVKSLNILPKGCIIAWNGNNPPTGWALCEGGTLSDGTRIPDLRGRFILGYGKGEGLTNRTLNATDGEETHKLTIDEMPEHRHKVKRIKSVMVGNVYTRYYVPQPGDDGHNISNDPYYYFETGNQGGDKEHNNMPPFYVLTYIMKT